MRSPWLKNFLKKCKKLGGARGATFLLPLVVLNNNINAKSKKGERGSVLELLCLNRVEVYSYTPILPKLDKIGV